MIAVDWGTSSFRAYRLDASGAVLEQRHAAIGLMSAAGRFEAVLAEQLAGWDDELVLMAGMIGSRNGWREVPYVPCPAGEREIAAGMLPIETAALPGRRILVAPGLSHAPEGAPPEVMRGEETQIVGLMDFIGDPGPLLVCLPGTHSKWVHVEDGRIVSLRSAMTGELYALLRRHSLLAALMPKDVDADADDPSAFARGVDASARRGGVANHLFGVRTLGLFSRLEPAAAPSYLSGLLIGHELRDLLPANRPRVHLLGGAALVQRYERALAALGVESVRHDEALSARGLGRLARARAASV